MATLKDVVLTDILFFMRRVRMLDLAFLPAYSAFDSAVPQSCLTAIYRHADDQQVNAASETQSQHIVAVEFHSLSWFVRCSRQEK
jgi:hypothetical protein